ncbi:Sporulation/nuclear morphology, partial [Terfezia claveryi]
NPLDAAPSSPQQIYLNLLILEASLRSQYLALTLRRRKYTFFFLLLILWTSYFTHSIFIHGPSPYYYVSLLQKLALGAGVMTLAIFWLSGLHKKTLVFPRKFVGNTNKGLRQFNIKLVSVPLTLCERIVGWLVIFPVVKYIWPRLSQARMPTPPLDTAASTPSTLTSDEEPLQPSGSHVKLVILPKGFSPDFREGWEIYRTDYWEKENERRAHLRKQIQSQ